MRTRDNVSASNETRLVTYLYVYYLGSTFPEGSESYLRISFCKTNYLDGYHGGNLTLDSEICTDPEFLNTF